MNILLTGHRGFIGQNILRVLNGLHDVKTFEWGDQYPNVKDFDRVLHIGAISSTTEKNVDKIMTQNYDFTLRILNDCMKYQIPLQFSSSASVYGISKTFKETDSPNPLSPYAWSKYLCERYLNREGVQIFRYFNVFSSEGNSEEHKGDQASPHYKFRKQAQTTGEIKLFEKSDRAFRDFIHVDEIIDYHLKFLNTKHFGIFNIGTGSCKSFKQVGEEIAKKYDAKIIVVPMPENVKAQYQWFTQANMSKTKHALGLI